MKNVADNLTSKDLRSFGLIMAVMIAAIFGLLLPWVFDHDRPIWPWYVSGAFALGALVFARALRPIYKLWLAFGAVMGWINTRLILGILYFAMFTPISGLFALIGVDPMRRRLELETESYRVDSKGYPREQMEKPY